MSSRGQIVIPQEVRDRCQLGAGDHFVVDDDPEQQTVVLRKVRDKGRWFEIYMECPHQFAVPPRRRQFSRRNDELAG